MDQTINRGYPYPECDPPLTKDASDIAHLYNLAQAVADDVQAIYDRADDVVIRPDACRRTVTGTITDFQVFPVFTATTFDTTGTAMSAGSDGIRLVEPGWYLVGAMVQVTSAANPLGLRLRIMLDGLAYSSFSPQAALTATNQHQQQYGTWVFSPNPNSTLSLWIRTGAAAPAWPYSAALWAQQGAKL